MSNLKFLIWRFCVFLNQVLKGHDIAFIELRKKLEMNVIFGYILEQTCSRMVKHRDVRPFCFVKKFYYRFWTNITEHSRFICLTIANFRRFVHQIFTPLTNMLFYKIAFSDKSSSEQKVLMPEPIKNCYKICALTNHFSPKFVKDNEWYSFSLQKFFEIFLWLEKLIL